MFCEIVINMLPTIFKCALKYKVHSGVQVYKLQNLGYIMSEGSAKSILS